LDVLAEQHGKKSELDEIILLKKDQTDFNALRQALINSLTRPHIQSLFFEERSQESTQHASPTEEGQVVRDYRKP
jgi:hypothetical protein